MDRCGINNDKVFSSQLCLWYIITRQIAINMRSSRWVSFTATGWFLISFAFYVYQIATFNFHVLLLSKITDHNIPLFLTNENVNYSPEPRLCSFVLGSHLDINISISINISITMFNLLHKHKKSDIRRRNELQNHVAVVWDEFLLAQKTAVS